MNTSAYNIISTCIHKGKTSHEHDISQVNKKHSTNSVNNELVVGSLRNFNT